MGNMDTTEMDYDSALELEAQRDVLVFLSGLYEKDSKGVGGWKGALMKAIKKNDPTPEGRNEEEGKRSTERRRGVHMYGKENQAAIYEDEARDSVRVREINQDGR